MSKRLLTVVLDEPGERVDKALANALPELSRAQCQRLIKEGRVTMDDLPVKGSQRLEGGEQVVVDLPEVESGQIEPQPMPLDIIYEDDDFILINKPAGIVVHPAAGHESGTLVNAVLAHCPDLPGVGGKRRPGVVHRLDKDTSGLIIFAKNDHALRYLQRQFKERTVGKVYQALVDGIMPQNEMLIDAPIGRDPRDRKKMAVIAPDSSARSRNALTWVKVLNRFDEYSFLECRPLTGRTHQIRVHLAFAGYPIVGDGVYGRRKQPLLAGRHFLHAGKLTFRKPVDGQETTFTTPLPLELQKILDELV
ncbi:MAG: RluA family pseudouridine synthase [Chloroflexota bacterium]|jgi:23S rRNA pseudouridine1911/1915/1917 synthase